MPFSVPKIKREIRHAKIWANRVAKRTPEEYNIRRFSHPNEDKDNVSCLQLLGRSGRAAAGGAPERAGESRRLQGLRHVRDGDVPPRQGLRRHPPGGGRHVQGALRPGRRLGGVLHPGRRVDAVRDDPDELPRQGPVRRLRQPGHVVEQGAQAGADDRRRERGGQLPEGHPHAHAGRRRVQVDARRRAPS